MKHIKTFESQEQSYWIYTKISTITPQIEEIKIFSDRESAENYYTYNVNEMAMDDEETDENLIFTFEDALEYGGNNEYAVSITEEKISEKFELPEDFILDAQTRKYNV